MEGGKIIRMIPLEDISEFTMAVKPNKEELEKILSYGFVLIAEVSTIDGTHYIFKRKIL